ncbi:hypothetical protein ACVW19_006715 [Streptomyces sp. TE5632]
MLVTDRLRSCGVAHRELTPSVEHRQSKCLNNLEEDSHQPTRQRERAMKGFRSATGTQRFLSVSSAISPHFRPRRHRLTAPQHRAETHRRFAIWNQDADSTCPPAEAWHPISQTRHGQLDNASEATCTTAATAAT